MSNEKVKNNDHLLIKYILTPEQIVALCEAHKKIIETGLIKLGFEYKEHEEYIESSEKTFNSLIRETQRILTEKGVKEQIRLEIKRDTKNTK